MDLHDSLLGAVCRQHVTKMLIIMYLPEFFFGTRCS